jgi:outer membrane lipoprotein-sorting protein
MKPITLILATFFLLASSLTLQAQDPQEIIRQADEKRRGIESSTAEMTMEIIRPNWTRSMSLKSWSKGDDFSLILVTAPARDKGTATLKRKKEIWNWNPRIERTIKLPSSMMSQSWMGSDFTNDDLVNDISLIDDYTHTLLRDTTLDGRQAWKIKMVPNEGVAVVWGKVITFVDKEEYIFLRSEYYDEEGYLVNVMLGKDIEQMGGRTLATRMEMIPIEEEGHQTVLTYRDIKFNQNLPEGFFSVQNMKQVR